jgi:hypothetical protein
MILGVEVGEGTGVLTPEPLSPGATIALLPEYPALPQATVPIMRMTTIKPNSNLFISASGEVTALLYYNAKDIKRLGKWRNIFGIF